MSSPSGPRRPALPPGFVADLCRTPLGRAKLSNILHDYRHKRLPKLIFKDFIKRLWSAWSGLASTPADVGFGVLEKVVKNTPAAHLCQGKPLAYSQTCSRVIFFEDLKTHNLLNIARLGLSVGTSSPREIQSLLRVGVSGHTTGTMQGRRPFAWVTPTAELDQVKRQHPADVVRNRLGLSTINKANFGNDIYLIEVQYPAPPFPALSLHSPTILEGLLSPDYRSKETSSGWGWTVDLETGADGLPEAVHPAIPFDDSFHLADIGLLSADPPPMNWAGFFAATPDIWDCDP